MTTYAIMYDSYEDDLFPPRFAICNADTNNTTEIFNQHTIHVNSKLHDSDLNAIYEALNELGLIKPSEIIEL